jgi:hypothetical protein
VASLLTLASLSGCHSTALPDTSGSAGSTAGTSAAGVGASGDSGASAVGGAGGSSTSATGGAGAPGAAGSAGSGGTGLDGGLRCRNTYDAADITVHLADGTVQSCTYSSPSVDAGFGFPPAPTTFTDTIESVEVNAIVFESGARIEVTAPGLDLSGIPRVDVAVKFMFGYFYACQRALEITTRTPPQDAGTLVPAARLLLAVADGSGPFADSSYKVDLVPLGCESAKGCGSPAPDAYAFDFSETTGNAPRVRVFMGDVAAWQDMGTSFLIRNLRSFQSTACDDYWNFAYTIVPALSPTSP